MLDAFSKKQCAVFTIESPLHCLFCSLYLSHTIGRGLSHAPIRNGFYAKQRVICNIIFAEIYQSFCARGGSKPPPYGVEIVLEYLLIKLSCALYLSHAPFTKIKEPAHIKVSSSLLRFLTRKRTGYGAEPRRKRVRGGATKKTLRRQRAEKEVRGSAPGIKNRHRRKSVPINYLRINQNSSLFFLLTTTSAAVATTATAMNATGSRSPLSAGFA